MTWTVRGYPSLQNYKDEVEKNPDALRPDCCPECKQPKLWLHGFYNRLIIRKDASRTIDEEAKILRFQCVQCEATFGALPEFICPRRWYLWSMQQIIITELLQGESIASAARNHDLSRDTVYRWNQWFMKNSEVYRKLLYSLNLQAGMSLSNNQYWLFRFTSVSLSHDMMLIYDLGIAVP